MFFHRCCCSLEVIFCSQFGREKMCHTKTDNQSNTTIILLSFEDSAKTNFRIRCRFFLFFFQLVVSSFQYFNHIIADSIYLSMCVSIVHLLFILVHLFHFFFILFRLIIYYYYGWNKSVIVYRKTVYQITQDDTRHSLHWKHVIERVCLPNEENGKLWHGWFHHYAYSYIWK